jgi:hypothetical protein
MNIVRISQMATFRKVGIATPINASIFVLSVGMIYRNNSALTQRIPLFMMFTIKRLIRSTKPVSNAFNSLGAGPRSSASAARQFDVLDLEKRSYTCHGWKRSIH